MPSRRDVLAGLAAGLGAGLALPGVGRAQGAGAAAPNRRRFAKLRRGLNASQWFEWVPSERAAMIGRIDGKYQARDFAQIRELGFDHVRVTLQPGFLAPALAKGDPAIDPARLKLFDAAMARISDHGLALVIDNHPGSPTKDRMAADESYAATVARWWRDLARHVARSPQYGAETTFLELLNEPEESFADAAKYRRVMEGLIAAAREGAPDHTLIVGGNMWNVPEGLIYNLKTPFDDANLIYTFHYYEPKSFTHQGVANAGVFYGKLKGVPWGRPAGGLGDAELAAFDPSVRESMRRYGQKGQGVAEMRPIFAALRDWCEKNGQLAWCGEFGVHYKGAPESDRVAWTRAVRDLCDSHGFGWCMYEARGGFGLFRPGETRPLTVDRPLLDALTL
ncbi:MAG: glycoside hydrolase family 5 protein [Alphaproteobacteria bacterium]